MLSKSLPVLLFLSFTVSADIYNQPTIAPNGVMSAASYLAPQFSNAGIAQGSIFLIFGTALGPQANPVVDATSFPLGTDQGLVGTVVTITAPGYQAFAPILYTSATQVAAILPSHAPLGNVNVTVTYQILTSNAAVIKVVQKGAGVFTLNEAGSGPAVIQNVAADRTLVVNTLLTSATPGQTVTLWGTGLGPVTGDEAAGPLPGDILPHPDVYVGGVKATVHYAGRSGCCAGLDQINFDVPANVSGCYVPVAVVAGGVVGNVGTMSVAASGKACDDPMSFHAADLATLQQNGMLRVGRVVADRQAAYGNTSPTPTVNASFLSYTTQALTEALAPINPALNSCYEQQARVNADPTVLPHGTPMNPAVSLYLNGPMGIWTIPEAASGSGMYSFSMSPMFGGWMQGMYTVSGNGGSVGTFKSSGFSPPTPAQWTNASTFVSAGYYTNLGVTFNWTSGDPNGYVSIVLTSANSAISTSIRCNAPASAGTFTVPDYMLRTLVNLGQGSFTLVSWGAPTTFTAPGLDMGTVRMSYTTNVPATFEIPAN